MNHLDSILSQIHKIVDEIRFEYSKESTNDVKNTLTLLLTTGFGLLTALFIGRALFHTSSSYYASLHRGEEDDIVQAVQPPPKTKTKKKKDDETVDFAVPLLGEVSFSTSWERRWQTLAMFTASLAFVLPMTLGCTRFHKRFN